MSDEIKLNWTSFKAALDRRLQTTSRSALAVLTEQARGYHREVIKITPPGHKGVDGGTRTAQQHGQAKVLGDIRKLYGTPSDAYDAIAEKSEPDARAFWALKTRRADAAADIVSRHTGTWYGPWDGGALHQRNFKSGGVRKPKGSKPIIYISDKRALDAYIKDRQDHVMYLTAGWKEIMQTLGIPLPSFIDRDAPGTAVIQIGANRLRVVGTNDVKYASNTDLLRRLQYALDRQTESMQRQWDAFVTKINKDSGLS